MLTLFLLTTVFLLLINFIVCVCVYCVDLSSSVVCYLLVSHVYFGLITITIKFCMKSRYKLQQHKIIIKLNPVKCVYRYIIYKHNNIIYRVFLFFFFSIVVIGTVDLFSE